jgi:hypothetical protein
MNATGQSLRMVLSFPICDYLSDAIDFQDANPFHTQVGRVDERRIRDCASVPVGIC